MFVVNRPSKQTRTMKATSITFGDEDFKGVLYHHDDALVVTLLIANYTTHRILIDNGSSTSVLF